MHRITILSKPGCHLCDVAKQAVNRLVGTHTTVLVEEIDILQNPDLHAQYKDDIPVILVDGVERFRHHVDPDKLAQIFYGELGEKLIGF
jgi:glutaredoxin